uniref:Cadherin domain-containing protein n=1 Tax=Caenorhabditis japonica TaxID=281687 RepID=A0A8R1IIY3_CAEJA
MASTSVREHEALELAVFKAKGQGVRNTLDHEDFSECPVFVIATKFLDNKPLSTITKILIKIVDINDNSPIFDQQLYHFNITENSGPTRIGDVHASDADSGDNAKLYYEIVGGDKNHEFMITENGEIETIRDLDRETQAEYHLIVEAIDGGKPRRR